MLRSTVILAWVLAASPAAVASNETARDQVPTTAPGPPAASSVLYGDFVDMGPAGGRAPGGAAFVALVNDSGWELDVTVGGGTARLRKEDVLTLRSAAGEVAFAALPVGRPDEAIQARLEVQAGRRYQIRLFLGPPAPADAAGAGGASSARPATASEAQRDARPARQRRGRVDVGRKRPRDRRR